MAADVWKIFQAMQLIGDFKSGSFYQVPPSLWDLVVLFQYFVRSAESICQGNQLTTIDSVCTNIEINISTASTRASLDFQHRTGDLLILTKPLGTGVLFAADMRAKARGPWIQRALQSMATSNGAAGPVGTRGDQRLMGHGDHGEHHGEHHGDQARNVE